MAELKKNWAPRLESMAIAKAKGQPTRDSLNIQLEPKRWIRSIKRGQYLPTVVGSPNLSSVIDNIVAEDEKINRLCQLIKNKRQNS